MGNITVTSCSIEKQQQGQYGTIEVWDFPTENECPRLITCLLYGN